MKVDTASSTEDEAPSLPPLPVPPWVPQSVADEAQAIYGFILFGMPKEIPQDVKTTQANKLLRFVCDERMRNVWRELLKRRRDGALMYPVKLAFTEVNESERQNAAAVELLRWILVKLDISETAVTRREAEQKHSELLNKAKQLRVDARNLFFQNIGYLRNARANRNMESHSKRCQVLIHAAKILEDYAAKTLEFDLSTAVDRDRGDRDLRWAAFTTAEICRAFFGSPMYGVTATIVSVLFDCDIKPRTVRQWCAHAADKHQKSCR